MEIQLCSSQIYEVAREAKKSRVCVQLAREIPSNVEMANNYEHNALDI